MLKKKISDAVSLATIGLASVAAATASLAASVEVNQASVSYIEKTAMTLQNQHVSRRTLINITEKAQASQASAATAQLVCTTPAPTTCPKEYAVCVSSNHTKGGVGRWECHRPAKKYNH